MGFNKEQSGDFWNALTTSPYEIRQGKVIAPFDMTVQQLLDSNEVAVKTLYALKPVKNKQEYEHFRLMADIRDYYLRYQVIEKMVNEPSFNETQKPAIVGKLKELLARSKSLDERFIQLNKGFLNSSEIKTENVVRNNKVISLYNRLSGRK